MPTKLSTISVVVALSSRSSSCNSNTLAAAAFFVNARVPPAALSLSSATKSMSKRGGEPFPSANDRPLPVATKKKAKQQQSLTGFLIGSTKDNSEGANGDDRNDANDATFKYKVFCDLDGVLVDFDSGVKSLFNGSSPNDVPQSIMWGRISSTPKFYTDLPWTSDGKLLWNTLVKSSLLLSPSSRCYPPDILTGVPRNFSSRAEKFEWCQRELLSAAGLDNDRDDGKLSLTFNHVDMAGKKNSHELVSGRKRKQDSNNNTVVNVITCWSRNKHYESKNNHVLIDDRLSLREDWENNGGIFIHHTSSEKTIQALRERGIISSSRDL